jgi:hypothetical protein
VVQTHQSRFLICLPVIMVHTRAIFASDVLPLHLTGVTNEKKDKNRGATWPNLRPLKKQGTTTKKMHDSKDKNNT